MEESIWLLKAVETLVFLGGDSPTIKLSSTIIKYRPDIMRLFVSVWLIAALDLILAGPTLQDNEPVPDLNLYSSEESDPLNVGSIDIALNSDLGGSEANFNINDFALDPNDLDVGSTNLGLDGYLTGSDINPGNIDSLQNPLDSTTLQASCGTENGLSGNVLRARDGESCKTGETTNLPLELFRNPEAAFRKFFEQKPRPEREPSTPSTPLSPSDQSKKCLPEFPIRCCTDEVGEYTVTDFQLLYFILPATCVPSTLIPKLGVIGPHRLKKV